MKIASFFCMIFLSGLCACVRELDVPFPVSEPQIVLNGILQPDSVIRISLSKTLAVADTHDFTLVTDAVVRMYEDEQLLGSLPYQDSAYTLNYHPKVGHQYRVEAEVPGYPTVRASDIVPMPPNVEICYREDTARRYTYSSAILNISIDDPAEEANFYWVDEVSTSPERPRCSIKDDSIVWNNGAPQLLPQDTIVCDDGGPPTFKKMRTYYYKSFSPVPDRFNAFVDNTSGGVTEFEMYVRVEDASLNGEMISFDLKGSGYDYLKRYQHISDQLSVKLRVMNASQSYDRYLKSSVIYALNYLNYSDEEVGVKPFAEVTQTYSNIENGTGIFAAYNLTSIEVGDFPCEEQ